MDETELVEDVVRLFEGVGVLILIVGAVYVGARALIDLVGRRPVYEATRKRFARSLLLGLEVLVAADVIQTVAVENTLRSVATGRSAQWLLPRKTNGPDGPSVA